MKPKRPTFAPYIREAFGTMAGLYCTDTRQTKEGHGYIQVSHPVRWAALALAPLVALEQYWFCVLVYGYGWPEWPGDIACNFILHPVLSWVDRHGVAMRWNAPDSGHPDEVGFWSRSDGSHERVATRVYIASGSTTVRHIEAIGTPPGVIVSGTFTATTSEVAP